MSEHLQCDECLAPVEQAQRYCVNCGAHRMTRDDPAARYLRESSARARQARPRTTAASARSRRGLRSDYLAAISLALLPIVAAIGVAVGRSTGSQDHQLIQALAHQRSQVVTGSASNASTTPTHAAAVATKHSARKTTAHADRATGGGKPVSTTKFGSVSQIAGTQATAAQKQAGAAATKSVQNSTGKSYVQEGNKLPSTVVVP